MSNRGGATGGATRATLSSDSTIARNAPPIIDRAVATAAEQDDAARIALIERSLLVLLVIALIIGVIAIVKPFITAILFGASLATAVWPAREALVSRGLGHGAAATVLLLASIALIGLPTLSVAPDLAAQLGEGVQRVESYFGASPAPPSWLGSVPLAGDRLALAWDRLFESEGNLRALSAPFAETIRQTIITAARSLADSVLQVILSLVIATMFWAHGDALAMALHDTLRRLGGPTAEQTLDIAGSAIRGVAYGVVGTAAIQALLLAVGLAIAGVPGAAMLGFVGLLLAISQIGAPLIVVIWGGASWWLFALDHQLMGGFMIAWGVLVSTIDNFIKPWFIGFGIQMPLSLTILGVFGGFVAFGFLGLFVGPTLIAVFFTLLQAWRATAHAARQQSPTIAENPD